MKPAFKRIMVATDFSAPSERAIQYAKGLASWSGAELHVLHVVEEPFPRGAECYVPEPTRLRKRLVANAEERLAGIAADLRMPEVTFHIRIGETARLIAETAASCGADLIVIGTHGREGLAHVILGSVAQRVVRQARCPVLTVHEHDVTAEAQRRDAAACAAV